MSVSLSAKIYYQGNVNPKFTFANNTFHDNQHFEKLNSSVQSTITVQNAANDSNLVFNSPTTGLIAYSSTITFKGNNIFLSNSGIDGSGMYGSSYIVLSRPALVNLTANNASHMVVDCTSSSPSSLMILSVVFFFQKTSPVNVDAKIILSKNNAGLAGSVWRLAGS